jgi:nucleotide-binding universal stress UspA family protein
VNDPARLDSHSLLLKYERSLKNVGLQCSAIALKGDPKKQLVRKLTAIRPAFVAICRPQEDSFSRAFLGSLSVHLVQNLSVPVLVLKD